MSLKTDDLLHLTAAQGFLQLGMPRDANEELEQIDPDVHHVSEVLEIRLAIYSATKNWTLMEAVALKLSQFDPDEPTWTLSWAFAARRAQSVEAARPILLNGVKRLPGAAILHFTLACYDCQLGDLNSAKESLTIAFRLDPKLRRAALGDRDLEPLWKSL